MTLQRLSPAQYANIRPLLNEFASVPLYCQGVLTGKYQGQIIVDDAEQPHSALLLKDIWCYLLGDPHQPSFRPALQRALAEKQFIGANSNVLFFVDPSPTWQTVLDGLVENRQPIETPRYLYVATPTRPPQPALLPQAYELRCIDESIREVVEGELPGDVTKVLNLRQGAEKPDEMAFGYVAMHGRTCAAWAVIDFMIEQEGEIRLVTDARYRRQGLAYATSAATIAHGWAQGLTQINWDVAASNIGSIRTAEKLGLTRLRKTKEFTIIFPEVGYLINLAWSHLDSGRFAQTQAVATQMVDSDKDILVQYGHFLMGAASAGLGHVNQAVQQLNQALDAGFDDLHELESCPSLAILHGTAEWDYWLGRLKTH